MMLITGGCGFIGSNFIHLVLEKYSDIDIINIDKLTYAGNIENLKSIEKDRRYSFVKGDIADTEKLTEIFNSDIDIVVNFAAETHVDRSISSGDSFIQTNIVGTNKLLKFSRKYDCKFVQISTDEVYGSRKEGYFAEQGLNFNMVAGDDFIQQVRDYMEAIPIIPEGNISNDRDGF